MFDLSEGMCDVQLKHNMHDLSKRLRAEFDQRALHSVLRKFRDTEHNQRIERDNERVLVADPLTCIECVGVPRNLPALLVRMLSSRPACLPPTIPYI